MYVCGKARGRNRGGPGNHGTMNVCVCVSMCVCMCVCGEAGGEGGGAATGCE